jgi:plasmid maintenance system antidote protein VapI
MNPQFWLNLQSAYELAVARAAGAGEVARLPRRPAA